jgi:hypothetical protein
MYDQETCVYFLGLPSIVIGNKYHPKMCLVHIMNLQSALLEHCHGATHICKDGICTSICDTPAPAH